MICPHCKHNLGDLENVMDKLHKNSDDYSFIFESPCCQQKVKAFRSLSMYFIVAINVNGEEKGEHEMIGAA